MRRALLLTTAILGASVAASAQNLSPWRILPGTNGVPSVAPHIVAPPTTTPVTTPVAATTFTPQASLLPGVLWQIDPAAPASTAAPPSTSQGIQVDDSNNVIEVSFPDGNLAPHGYGNTLLVANGWSTGRPVLHDTAAQPNSGYDGLLLPTAYGKRVAQASQSSDMWFVVRQISTGGLELFRNEMAGKGLKALQAPGATDCALRLESNIGSAAGNEPSGPLTVCGQRQIIEVTVDDTTGTVSLFRNGTLTLTTSGGQINAYLPDNYELMNQCNCDVAFVEQALGMPTIAQRQAEMSRLAAIYPTDGAMTAITAGPAAKAPVAVDLQGDFNMALHIPLAGGNGVPFPTSSNIVIGDGLAMEAGATQVFGAVFGTDSAANIQTTQQVYDTFFLTTMEGNYDQIIGSPMDTGQGNNSTFFTVLRNYPPSSPNNLHVIAADGLHLRAACSANHTNCGPGNIYGAGIILSQLPLHPGMTVKLRRKSPAGDLSWVPAWLFSINQGIPPTGTTSLFSAAGQAVRHDCGKASVTGIGSCQEIDIDDGFSRKDAGTTTGLQINHGYPNIYGGVWERNKYPHLTYGANAGGYVTHLGAGPDYEELPFNQSAAFHDMVFDWRPDGSMNLFEDGKVVISGYQDFTKSVAYQDANGVTQYVGMQLMIMNQAVPGFANNRSSAIDNDGLGVDGWAGVYREIAIYNGNVANPQNFLASATNAYAGVTGNPSFAAGETWTLVANGTRVFTGSDGAVNLATSVSYTANGTTGPETTSLVLIGLSTSSTTPPSCSGPEEGAWTCFGTTKYFNNGAGAWINFRNPNPTIPALPSGTYYIWVQTPDGVNHLGSTTPYVK